MIRFVASWLLALSLLAGVGLTLAACNTAAGFGQDMTQAGHAITNSAEQNK